MASGRARTAPAHIRTFASPAATLIDDALLHIPADATLQADARGIPTGVELPVDGTDVRLPDSASDWLAGPRHGVHAACARTTTGVIRIALTTPDGGHGAAVWMDGSHRYVMIYSGDTLPDVTRRRRGLAIEPMTCAPDAFNSGAGLLVLQPGEAHSSTWGIAPL